MRYKALVAFVFALAAVLRGATWYVSSGSGDDSRTSEQAQSEATPWKTIEKVNSLTLQPGDKVFFKRADTFRGGIVARQNGSAGSPITFGAYGAGAAPRLHGTAALSQWTVHQGSIYTAAYTGDRTHPIEQLFVLGKPMELAREPDQGYFTMDSIVGRFSFFSNALKGSTDWTGASVHIRSERWSLDYRVIVAHDKATGQVTVNKQANYELRKGWGFFLNNSRAALDRAGEWYYDSSTGTCYAWMPGGGAPADVEGAVVPYGADLAGRQYVTVENLTFVGHAVSSVRASGSHIVLTGCTMEYADGHGIDATLSDSRIENCRIRYPNVRGIRIDGDRNVVTGTAIFGVGLAHRLNRKGYGGGCCTGRGLDFGGTGNVVSGNVLDSIGYIGIGFGGENNRIERNVVDHCCVTIDDGAGIYTWSNSFDDPGAAGTIVRKNIVMNGEGAPQGAGGSRGWAHGIYLDDRTHHIQLDSNTTFNNQLGIFLHNNRYHTVFDNVCYGNREGQIRIQRDGIVTANVYGNQVYRNVFFSTASSQPTITEARHVANDSVLAHLSANIECSETVFGIECRRDGALLWKQNYLDVQSITVGANRIVNGDFDSSTLAWGSWPSEYLTLILDKGASPDGSCLRARYAGDPETRSPIFQARKTYPLEKGKLYRLAFSAKENHKGTMYVTARIAYAPWTENGLGTSVALDTSWNDYELFIEPTVTDTNCRVDFYASTTDSLIWLDNVSLHEIDRQGIPTALRSRLFCNSGASPTTFPLGADTWRAPDGARGVRGAITVAPFLSRVLVKDSLGIVSAGREQQGRAHPPAILIGSFRDGVVRVRIGGPLPKQLTLELRSIDGRRIARQTLSGKEMGAVVSVRLTDRQPAAGLYVLTASDGVRSATVPLLQAR